MKYTVCITETVTDTFEVEADSLNEAIMLAEQNYDDEVFVPDSGNVIEAEMTVYSDETGEEADAIELI